MLTFVWDLNQLGRGNWTKRWFAVVSRPDLLRMKENILWNIETDIHLFWKVKSLRHCFTVILCIPQRNSSTQQKQKILLRVYKASFILLLFTVVFFSCIFMLCTFWSCIKSYWTFNLLLLIDKHYFRFVTYIVLQSPGEVS